MNRITIDDELRDKLLGLTKPLQLCDETGQVVGRVFPAADLSQYEPWEPVFDEEELRRGEQTSKRYATQELLDRLEEL